MTDGAKFVSASGEHLPSHYIVEIMTEGGARYALCERMMVVTPGADSLPAALVEELFGRSPLRAVAVPTDALSGRPCGPGMTEMMKAYQSGLGPQININIYNNSVE